ncbi:MAG: hypothetical protein ACRCY8_19215 [Dermatophilaceae bacterium]
MTPRLRSPLRARHLLTVSALACGLAMVASGSAGAAIPADDAAPAPAAAADGPADLILFPGPADAKNPLGPSNRTASLIENKEIVQGLLPSFAGITLDVPSGWSVMKPGYTADSAAEIKTFVQPLLDSGAIEGFTHNLVRAQVRPEAKWNDDAAWARITGNFGELAKVSKAFGAKGILFDIENYVDVTGDGKVWDEGLFNWDQGVDGDLVKAEQLARQRGKELMSAVLAAQPDAEVVFTRGTTDCVNTPVEVDPWTKPDAFELQCPFIAGAIDAATAPGQVQDGGQLYNLRDADDFRGAYTWRDSGLLAEPQMDFLSDADKTRWTEYVNQSYGVMTKWRQNKDYEMDPAAYEEALFQALTNADDLAWAYTTEDDILRPGFPAEWRTAIDTAVARAQKTTGASTSGQSATPKSPSQTELAGRPTGTLAL